MKITFQIQKHLWNSFKNKNFIKIKEDKIVITKSFNNDHKN